MLRVHSSTRRTAQPPPGASLCRRERLFRWAELLEREPTRQFDLLAVRDRIHAGENSLPSPAGSPLDIAFRDPILRIEGLRGSSAAEALSFFQLSPAEYSRILGWRRRSHEQSGRYVAWRIRNVADPSAENRLFFLGLMAALLLAVIILLASGMLAARR